MTKCRLTGNWPALRLLTSIYVVGLVVDSRAWEFNVGIYQGSLAFTRYRVLGDPGKTTIASLSKLIQPFIAPPLRIDGPVKPENIGWVRPLTASDEDVVSEDSHWDLSDCHVNDGFLLRLRYEKRKIPASLVQTFYKSHMREHLQKNGKNMPKSDRQEYKQKLMTDLLKRALPVIQFTDGYWRETAGELLVFSTSNSVRLRFEQLFHQSFGAKLDLSLIRLDGPLTFLEHQDADEKTLAKRLSRLAKIEPAVFSPHRNL